MEMNDFFKQDQETWWNDFVEHEVYQMRQEFDAKQAQEDFEEFDLDVPF